MPTKKAVVNKIHHDNFVHDSHAENSLWMFFHCVHFDKNKSIIIVNILTYITEDLSLTITLNVKTKKVDKFV